MVLLMEILTDWWLETHWDIITVKWLSLMKEFGSTSPLRIHWLLWSYFFGMGPFGVCCSVQKVLWQRKIIVIDADSTVICENVAISAFGVCCPAEKKVFGYPWRMLLLSLAWDIMPLVLALSAGLPWRPPLLPLDLARHGREYTSWSWGGCSEVLCATQQVKVQS